MTEPRTSVPMKKKSPVGMILILLLLAGGAGVLTWWLYPRPEPDPVPTPRPRTVHRPPALVDMPVEEPVPTETPADASTETSDADVEQDAGPAKTQPRRRRRMPEGRIDRRQLQAFIRTKAGQVRQCYERRLKINNMLQGVLVPQVRIHPNGSVMSVSFAQDTLHDQGVRSCVKRLIQSWRFPQPQGGAVTVSFPYRFAPRND